MSITTLITLITSSLLSTAPDLCDTAYLNAAGEPVTDSAGQTLSRYCAWAGPDAPQLETNVCCTIESDIASCSLANPRGRCRSGVRMWCSHGEVDSSTGQVACMQVFPNACDAGECLQAPPDAPQEFDGLLCCGPGGCVPIEIGDPLDCEGSYLACEWGMSLPDGTVECFQ